MPAIKSMVGKRFGRWLVLERAENNKRSQARWLCVCDCGTKKVVNGADLRRVHSRSCGCLQAELTSKRSVVHGRCDSDVYVSWSQMVQRCNNPSNPRYSSYGDRNVRVCDRWLNFENFLADMGERPENTSLHRVDNDGNYEHANCRWATPKEQARNRTNNTMLSHDGHTFCIAEFADILGISADVIYDRKKRGWSDSKALTSPVRKHNRRNS